MTDGVARELEQAEARMADAREEAWDASRRLLAAAIEVGRLRALAGFAREVLRVMHHNTLTDQQSQRYMTSVGIDDIESLCAALAAREEAQGV